MGARPLRRTIQDTLEDGVAEYYLDHPEVHDLQATLDDNEHILIEAQTEPVVIKESVED
jgi:ATP-dependent Clp protease ATP-binding subunit ClpE